ncbi:hydrogenase maturation protease [Cylindrospermum stagnale PCC 7417]|uniref:Hydrogenase maturation protease n=1 Tax=Cylindrospermum stagnale PCC 7417 TaxID=56107 RepID=K9WUR2_9NOST|nr:hydrogenase maturation protease [Cylindrospermum stagnale PCC 7417]
MAGNIMVIGYGNALCSDDGIGQRVANAIESWHLSTVETLAIQQLTPELAASLANADLAIFVDACMHSAEADEVQVRPLSPSPANFITRDEVDPRSLLALTQSLYGHCPPAWWVTIPGTNFQVGDALCNPFDLHLSPVARTGMAIALVKIMQILGQCQNIWMNLNSQHHLPKTPSADSSFIQAKCNTSVPYVL